MKDLEGRSTFMTTGVVGPVLQQTLAHSSPGGNEQLLTCSLGNTPPVGSISLVVEVLLIPSPSFA